MTEPVAIICMPADLPETTVRGVVFDRVCAECQTRVMISQSSLRLIRGQPETDFFIICFVCFLAQQLEEVKIRAMTPEQIAELRAGIVSNPWRRRN